MGSEVKGSYFVSARQRLEELGAGALERSIAAMPAASRDALSRPLSSDWYPEDALFDAFHAVHREVCDRDPARFRTLIAECTHIGARRFFRSVLSIATPGFYLRNYATIVAQLRRGPTRVDVVTEARSSSARIVFVDLPHSDDPLYHQATFAGFDFVWGVMKRPPPRMAVTAAAPMRFELSLSWD